jgi:hypothetical protein
VQISEGNLRKGSDLKLNNIPRTCNKVTTTTLFKIGWMVRGG